MIEKITVFTISQILADLEIPHTVSTKQHTVTIDMDILTSIIHVYPTHCCIAYSSLYDEFATNCLYEDFNSCLWLTLEYADLDLEKYKREVNRYARK